MAVTFSDLHTESGLKSLNEFLVGKSYISSDQISKDDIKVYGAVLEKPGDVFPNASKWYESVSSQLASSFPGKAVGGKAAAAPVEAGPAKEAAGDEDDDLDLFGDETEEDKKAVEEREKAKKASSKKRESGKSSVLMDVKPWDDETDMVALEKAVRSVEMPGLFWGASKLVPVGYGIKKLQIMLTIVDDLVSVDSLIEEHLTVSHAVNMSRAVTLSRSTKYRTKYSSDSSVAIFGIWSVCHFLSIYFASQLSDAFSSL